MTYTPEFQEALDNLSYGPKYATFSSKNVVSMDGITIVPAGRPLELYQSDTAREIADKLSGHYPPDKLDEIRMELSARLYPNGR